MVEVFAVDVFFIVFRETLEASVIISVLLAFIKQGLGKQKELTLDRRLYKKLVWQVWIGAVLGLVICLCLGGAFIGVFYGLGNDIWANSEDLWEGIFSVIAVIMITIMGVAMLRLNKMKEKWRVKIAQAIIDSTKNTKSRLPFRTWMKKYALAILPFVTTLREGVEAIVYVGGVSLGHPASAFPLAVICGLLCGIGVGVFLYLGGNQVHMQYFLIVATCFLYLICAGLWSRAIWYFQLYVFSKQAGGDVAESGSGPGSYNIKQSVWHVNCCNGETDNGWMIFNALFGWTNSATYGSVISYNVFWIFLICVFASLMYEEKKGYLPGTKWFYKTSLYKKIWARKQKKVANADELIREAENVAAEHYGQKLAARDDIESNMPADRTDSSSEEYKDAHKDVAVTEKTHTVEDRV